MQTAFFTVLTAPAGREKIDRSRTPVCVFLSGRLVFGTSMWMTLSAGEYRESRTEYIHWLQDVHDHKAIVAQYCRYTAEIKRDANVK
ncbi:hypothetical protein HBI24_168650 [Parastagonospora nodorum]|nr:hypothetical protein HBH52_175740 [Parastagonospora nodorum]KAH4116868.1 hypothetical protein HBH47_161880 [Parastagonospora nodorum]KAH4218500.1 hypothetical protein HBI06_200940 [Parastagonospora nodorum]KAH4231195.1 hypothetical protein HBI05_181360 [Parastagonospora nodorum]KAH4915037.1 hypothetical protein HBH74_146130 [Parastagonospora nodorum]